MARKPRMIPPLDPSLYTGRIFLPAQDVHAAYPDRPTIQSAIGANGMVCVEYDTTGMKVGNTLTISIAPFPHPPNMSEDRMSSIGARGDFSKGARAGQDQGIQGQIVEALDADGYPAPVPANWNGTYVPIAKGSTVWINVANEHRDSVGGEMRIQVNHS